MAAPVTIVPPSREGIKRETMADLILNLHKLFRAKLVFREENLVMCFMKLQ